MGCTGLGYVAVHVCQENAGSLPREVGSEMDKVC